MAPTKAYMMKVLLSCAKGSYQRDLIKGRETWSGSTLRGKALDWSCKYTKSRTSLLNRIIEESLVRGWVVGSFGGTSQTGPKVFIIQAGRTKVILGSREGNTSRITQITPLVSFGFWGVPQHSCVYLDPIETLVLLT